MQPFVGKYWQGRARMDKCTFTTEIGRKVIGRRVGVGVLRLGRGRTRPVDWGRTMARRAARASAFVGQTHHYGACYCGRTVAAK